MHILSSPRPLAALTAAIAALAVAVPAASASAAKPPQITVDPQVCQLMNPNAMGPFGPAQGVGGASLASVLNTAGGSVGCPAQVLMASSLPTPYR
jgi:hypothetical protein